MLHDTPAEAQGEAALEPFEAVEISLALDLQEPTNQSFETCLRNAVEVVGGEILFDMPADGSVEDASRIAAVRVPSERQDRIIFAILDETETTIRIADREEIGDRFYGFARAFVGVLERLRDDFAAPAHAPEGSA